MTERYEALRTAALGGQFPFEARNGLALFLRRGMWGWARASAAPATPPGPVRSTYPCSAAGDERRAVVQLFAAMAMRSADGRTP